MKSKVFNLKQPFEVERSSQNILSLTTVDLSSHLSTQPCRDVYTHISQESNVMETFIPTSPNEKWWWTFENERVSLLLSHQRHAHIRAVTSLLVVFVCVTNILSTVCLVSWQTAGARSQYTRLYTHTCRDTQLIFTVSRHVCGKGQVLLEPLTPPPPPGAVQDALPRHRWNAPTMQWEWDKQSDASSFKFRSRNDTSSEIQAFHQTVKVTLRMIRRPTGIRCVHSVGKRPKNTTLWQFI